MKNTLHIAVSELRFILRSPFFWIWNSGALALVLGMRRFTYFDFDGRLVAELVSATLGLSGAVNAFVFYTARLAEVERRQWDLLITRPVRPIELILGRWGALLGFQALVTLGIAGAHGVASLWFKRPLPDSPWSDPYFSLLQTGMLAAVYCCLSGTLNELWAIVLMVAAFVLGHLATHISLWLGELPLAASLLFSLIPDLDLATLGGQRSTGATGEAIWKSAYAISYCTIMLYIASAVCWRAGGFRRTDRGSTA